MVAALKKQRTVKTWEFITNCTMTMAHARNAQEPARNFIRCSPIFFDNNYEIMAIRLA